MLNENGIPNDIKFENLPGPQRSGPKAPVYYHDEIVWSPDKEHFALAYTITEPTMGNHVARILWGHYNGTQSTIFENTINIWASCNKTPWSKWIDKETFIFKAQKPDEKRIYQPLVVIILNKGFSVIPQSNDGDIWWDTITNYNAPFQPYNEQLLIASVIETP